MNLGPVLISKIRRKPIGKLSDQNGQDNPASFRAQDFARFEFKVHHLDHSATTRSITVSVYHTKWLFLYNFCPVDLGVIIIYLPKVIFFYFKIVSSLKHSCNVPYILYPVTDLLKIQ